MKATLFFRICILTTILFLFTNIMNVFSQVFTSVDFEAGGYVTELYSRWGRNEHTLYCRTDIGGVYSLSLNPPSSQWTFLSTYATSPAGLHVQGLAFKNPNIAPKLMVACGTDYMNTDPDRGVWKYDNFAWTKVLGPGAPSPYNIDINFGGNVFHSKVGGECIVYFDSPNWKLIVGGRYSNSTTHVSPIYYSTDDGDTWTLVNNDAMRNFVTGNVSTIVADPTNSSKIWVGTDEGIWLGNNNNGNWSWTKKKNATPPSGNIYNTPVHRIIMKQDASMIFVAQGEEVFRSTDDGVTWDPLSFDDAGVTNNVDNIISAVNLFDNDTKLLISRIGWKLKEPRTKISTDFGVTFGNNINMPLASPNPKHAQDDKYHAYYSKTNFLLDGDYWYCSGGAGPYKSVSSDIYGNWEYLVVDEPGRTHGINMPVVYDVTFGLGTGQNSLIFIPIADWTLARIENTNPLPMTPEGQIRIKDYARIETGSDDYVSNATRILVSADDPSIVYFTGGNLFINCYGSLFRSIDYGNTFSQRSTNLTLLNPDHSIIDGSVSQTNANELLVVVGGGYSSYEIGFGTDRGIFISTDGGINFDFATGISANAIVDELFTHQRILARDPNDDNKVYAYFEGSSNEGGIYSSNNGGRSWTYNSQQPLPQDTYFDKGCLRAHNSSSDLLYIAILDEGLFSSDDGGNSWNSLGNFISASQVDARDNNIVVLGNQNGGNDYNEIFYSTNSGSSWSVITNTDYRLPSACHLTLDPNNSNRIWISTSGQGVYMYEINSNDKNTYAKSNENLPDRFLLSQNFPNPFNPSTCIRYVVPHQGLVTLKVFDIMGKEVASLVDGERNQGEYTIEFNASVLSSGIYFYKLTAGSFVSTKKMILVK